MGDCHNAFHAQHAVSREVRSIGRDFSRIQSSQQGIGVHQSTSGKVENPNPIFHFLQRVRSHHALILLGQGEVQSDVITFGVNFIQTQRAMHCAGKVPSVLHGQEGVIAIDFHPQGGGRVCHQNANGSQADNAQGFPLDFRSGKGSLALFNELFHLVALALQGFYPSP